jgi:Leucine-rich repeat (LRR) protein
MFSRKINSLFLLLSFLLFSASWLQAAIPAQERNALIALYNSTNGANWTNKTGWLGPAGTECNWYGVGCDDFEFSVFNLSLANNNLSGSIPQEIGNLTYLVSLEMASNQLSGSIPSGLGNLAYLGAAILHSNRLSGSIPPALGNLGRLKNLFLSSNQLSGSIPPELGNLANLGQLDLSSNQLSGSIPPALGNLGQLLYFQLNGNQMSGSIPPALGNLANLGVLTLAANRLSGSIPPELGNLGQLIYLHLEGNQLSGSIPPALGNLANLRSLYLQSNQLSGSIPPALGNLGQLIYFSLSSNQLSGSIPPELGNLANLASIDLYGNQLSGNIPPALGNLANLRGLYLYSNQLSGSIPPELGNLANLAGIDLYGNQLSGNIPPALGNLANLQFLSLMSNQLSGSIPPELGNLANLEFLNLSSNKLSGNIPTQLTNLIAATYFSIDWNALHTTDSNLTSYLNARNPGWQNKQTVAPTGVSAIGQSSTSISVSWTPINYTGETGQYEVYWSISSGGPYVLGGSTSSKLASSLLLTGLNPATTYYMVVNTITTANIYNTNTVTSEYCPEVFATTNASGPATITITVNTSPAALSFAVDGTNYTASQTFSWAVGSNHMISTNSPQGSGGTRYVFASWSDGGAISHGITVPATATTYTANFTTQYLLTTAASPTAGGTVSPSPTSMNGFYDSGTAVQLTATANSGYVFSSWSGALTGSTNPQSITMSAPRNVAANFSSSSGITISTNPAGVSFAVDGNTYTSVQTFSWTTGSIHTIFATTQQGSGDTRYVFANWSDGGTATHIITAPATATTYTANFTIQYALTTLASPSSGGTIAANPASADGFYNNGTLVQLTAAPSANYVFSNWSGDVTGTANPETVVMVAPRSVTATFTSNVSNYYLTVSPGGASNYKTLGTNGNTRAGYAIITVNSGTTPYGIGVFSLRQNGVTVSEAGVPASPPTTRARILIDFRSGVAAIPGRSSAGKIDINTGMAVANTANATANLAFTLRDPYGVIRASGNGTIAAGGHFAKFIDSLKDVAPNFNLPSDFQNNIQFGSLEITSDRPVSVLALRGTMNQRNEFLITTTPVADLTQASANNPIAFPQFVDGGGYTTSLILMNTSLVRETGKFEIRDKDGNPLIVNQAGGTRDSSFSYSIEPGGVFRFQTDGFPVDTKAGWVRMTPDAFTPTPVASGLFGYNPNNVLVSESGIPAANAATHVRVYVDLSDNHNTGLAIANVSATGSNNTINAYEKDGVTAAGTSKPPVPLPASGYKAAFADEFVTGLPAGFTGVLDISSTVPFAALTLRSLNNERGDFLMTTFPVADANQPAPSPIVFPQIADGGGYATQIMLISAGQSASTTVSFYDENGAPVDFGK